MSAAQRGSREVGLAVVSTTLAVCAVFVSIAFMRSVIGRYFYEFGVAVTAAVCVSIVVAFTLTPMLASRMLRKSGEPGWLFRALRPRPRRAGRRIPLAAGAVAAAQGSDAGRGSGRGPRRLRRRLDSSLQSLLRRRT